MFVTYDVLIQMLIMLIAFATLMVIINRNDKK